MTMSVPSLRSPRPSSAASYQSSSPRLPSPLNPSTNFLPSLQDSVSGMSDSLSPLRDRLEPELTSPRPSSGATRPCTSHARHPSPSDSPFAQGIPLLSSSPRPSSPLASPPRSPWSHSPRSISPCNGLLQGSSPPIHSMHSQSQCRLHRSPFHLHQSHFLPSQSSPLQPTPSPHYTRTQSLIQQSFGSPSTSQVVSSSPPDGRRCNGSLSAQSPPHLLHNSLTPFAGHPSAQDEKPVVKGDLTPLNEAPHRWWGGRSAWVEDWDGIVQQFRDTCDLCAVHTLVGGDVVGVKRSLQADHGSPSSFSESFGRSGGRASAFLDEEIRASFDAGATYRDPLERGFTRASLHTNTSHKVEGIPVPRTAPVPIPPPINENFGLQNTSDDLIRCQPSYIRAHGIAGGLFDGSGSSHIQGRSRRLSDASTHSSVSYTSCTSGPSQSQSQSHLLSPSKLHTKAFPSLSSLGIGIEKAEREELRSRSFWARPRKDSEGAMKRQGSGERSEGVGHGHRRSPSVRSSENDRLEGVQVENIKAWEATDHLNAESRPLGAHTQEKETVKLGSILFRTSPKQVDILEEQLHRERYERTEKCVSLAITSILPVATITRLSPVGEALVKVRESVKYIGHELAPVVKETLSVSTDLLSLAPLPGIEEAAKALLNVWNACQKVDTNRLACLRLAERCATLLYSVRCEISEAGMETALALDEPVEKLCGALAQIQTFLEMQLHRPFLKRYVRREEIARELVACNEAITDAGSRFGISVQIRTYHEVCSMMKESKRSSQEVQALLSLDHQIMHHCAMMCGQQMRIRRNEAEAGNALGLTTGTPPPAYGPPTSGSMATEPAPKFRYDGHSPTLSLLSIEHAPDEMGVNMSALPTPTPTRATFATGATETQTTRTTITTTEADSSLLPMRVLARVHRAQDSEDAAADEASLRGTLVGALNAHDDLEMVRCLQVARGEIPEAAETLRRMLGSGSEVEMDREVPVDPNQADVRNTELDKKFIQCGIEAMTRLTNVVTKRSGIEEEGPSIVAPKLPSWTITRYEVTRTRKIGAGLFSNSYRGHWRKLPVFIKVLMAHGVTRDAFVRHVELWDALDHPNILPLYGASSAVGDKPWFFVSKFCSGGNLATALRRARMEGTMTVGKGGAVGIDLLRSVHEIAKGMAYLHGRGILHGDLRAMNVLVDESGKCVLSGFGEGEIKLEVHRSCGQLEPHPIRWWAPERLLGDGRPSYAADVYAFAICCIEILGMGDLPWTTLDDRTIREFVLDRDERPPIPVLAGNAEVASVITNLVDSCWAREPDGRPSFVAITSLLEDACRLQDRHRSQFWQTSTPPMNTRSTLFTSPTDSSPADELYETAPESMTTEAEEESMDCMMDVSLTSPIPTLHGGEVIRSLLQVTNASQQVFSERQDRDASFSAIALVADMKNEENYRSIVGSNHGFHSSLTLPLWSPTRVELGAVGYISKSGGEFITLLNAIDPPQSCEEPLRRLPSLYGYGSFEVQRREDGKRSVAQRGLDAISGFLTFKTRGGRSYAERIARQYTFPLVQGTSAAYLCVEKTVHRYMDRLEAPTMWFKQHADLILDVYGLRRGIRREDLILVVGTLDAPDWAVFVSEDHCDGRAQFNVFASREKGEPWGIYTLERMVKDGNAGPARWVDVGQGTFVSKVSCVAPGTQEMASDTVMLAGLRFEGGAQTGQ